VPIDDLLTPWVGSALRHIRTGSRRDVLDFSLVGSKIGNRWNEPHDPTLYVAGDISVLVAEWGRHLESYSDHHTTARTV
jgi:RES domain-containing protein